MRTTNITTRTALFIAFCFCIACNHRVPKQITKAFYYWKTNFALSPFEQSKLDSFQCKTLYLRFFDIDWSVEKNAPKPVAINNFIQPVPAGFTCVPVIFITQDALKNVSLNSLAVLAQNLTNLLYEKCVQAKISPLEIQIDYDWTVNSKNRYFLLLNLCKKQPFFKGKTLSCTIRLHQVHSPDLNGIPPVNKGLLMCYNMGNLKLAGANNSIIDVDVAKRYLDNLNDYILPLDVALPLFNWALLYDDKNRFTGILRDVQENDLRNTAVFTTRGNNIYSVNKDTLWRGYNLQKDETVRYEYCSVADLHKLAAIVASKINNPSFSLIFYHCDSTVLSKYTNNDLEKYITISISTVCIVVFAKYAYSCIAEAVYYAYPSFFGNKTPGKIAYRPFFYVSDELYYNNYEDRDEDESDLLNLANIKEWQAYSGGKFPQHEVDTVLNNFSIKELLNGKSKNAFAHWLVTDKAGEANAYLIYAKQCEPYVTASDWDTLRVNADSSEILMNKGLNAYAKTILNGPLDENQTARVISPSSRMAKQTTSPGLHGPYFFRYLILPPW